MKRRLVSVVLAATALGGCSAPASPLEEGSHAVEVTNPAFDLSPLGDGYRLHERGRVVEPTPTEWQYSTGEWLDLLGPDEQPIRIHRMEGERLSSATEPPHVGLTFFQGPVTVGSKRALSIRQDDASLAILWVERDGVEYSVSSPLADEATLLHVAEAVRER